MKSTICLNMIVKDEEHVIKDTLENLCKYIKFDYWVISDTGSSDRTKEIIQEHFKDEGIEGELFEDEWKGFGHNRSLALEYAYDKTDYVLIFDADDRIHGDLKLPPTLTHDSYTLKIGCRVSYVRILLVNNRKRWKYMGVLHEYIQNIDSVGPSCMIDGNYFIESGKSGNRSKDSNKYKKDAEILEKEFEVEEDTHLKHRYAFYCGQSYRDCGNLDKSIEWYKKVLTLNNWVQEKYVSCINIANQYEKKNEMDSALEYWGKSYEYDSERNEGGSRLMEYYYNKGQHLMVNALYHKFKNKIIMSNPSKLFLDTSRNYLVEYFNSISAYYANDKASGYECCKIIILLKNSFQYYETTIKNFVFYKEFLDKDKDKIPIIRCIVNYIRSTRNEEIWNTYRADIRAIINKAYKELEALFELSPLDNKCSREQASNKILIYTGFLSFKWNYTYSLTNSLGGSERAVAYLANELPKDYEIIISGDVEDEVVDNVRYVNRDRLNSLLKTTKFYAIIVSRYVSFLEMYPRFSCYKLILSAHDTYFINTPLQIHANTILERWNSSIDNVIALTDWHRNNLISMHPSLKGKFTIINNGILPSRFPEVKEKRKNSFIYTSCSNRGLMILLELWSKIIEHLPDATLNISSYVNFPNDDNDRKMQEIIDIHPSITHHGQLATTELYEMMSKSEYWLYPSIFPETSCITALEMLRTEVICVYYPYAGLGDTIKNYGIKVNKGEEIEKILALTEYDKKEMRSKGREYAESCSWSNRAGEWSKMLKIKEKEANKPTWCFYYSDFTIEPVEQYIHNQSKGEYNIVISNNREEIISYNPSRISFIERLFDDSILSYYKSEYSILQTEPLNLSCRLNVILDNHRRYPDIKIYDYSKSNINILLNYGVTNCEYLPYNAQSDEIEKLKIFLGNNKKEYDFGFIYNWKDRVFYPPRRRKVIEFLRNNNFKVNIIAGYDDNRDIELAKCKIILNIHGQINNNSEPTSDEISNIFEHLRCDRLLESGYKILSESSLDLDPEYIERYSKRLTIIEYDDFFNVDVVNDMLDKKNICFIDCFTFYNELEMLTYRLNILNDVVDYFVLVEATHTFAGKEKPLFYQENKHLFEKINHKIIHIIVDDLPHTYPDIDFEKNEQWNNERFQRNCISRGIDKLKLNSDDLIIISDVDEIPRIELLEDIKYNHMKINEVKALQMDFYYYNLHSKLDHYTDVARMLPYNLYKNLNMTIDDLRFKYHKNFINNSGWHLSYFGDENFIKNKIENFAHQELNIDLFTSQEKIQNRIQNTLDLFDRPTKLIHINIEDNDNLPPAYDIYLTNFYTDSIQNIKSSLVKYSNLRDNICKFENYDDYINWQIKTGLSYEKDNYKWMNGQRKCVETNFNSMDRNIKILDICCGDGQGLKKFKEMDFKNVYGVEVCKDKINFAKQYGYTIYECDICSGPFDIGDNYDCIYSSHTIEHVLNPEYTIRNIMTKLKDDGKFILILPYPDYQASNTHNEHSFKVHCGVIPLGLHINDKGITLINKIQQMGYKVTDYTFQSYREPEIQLIITK